MASKLKKFFEERQRAESERVAVEKSSEAKHQPDRRSSSTREDGDDFPTAPNIAAKIAQRRLPRRTPTSHVKGVGGDLIRRRLSKTNEQLGSTGRSMQSTIESSFEEETLDEPGLKAPPPTRQSTDEKPTETMDSSVPPLTATPTSH